MQTKTKTVRFCVGDKEWVIPADLALAINYGAPAKGYEIGGFLIDDESIAESLTCLLKTDPDLIEEPTIN